MFIFKKNNSVVFYVYNNLLNLISFNLVNSYDNNIVESIILDTNESNLINNISYNNITKKVNPMINNTILEKYNDSILNVNNNSLSLSITEGINANIISTFFLLFVIFIFICSIISVFSKNMVCCCFNSLCDCITCIPRKMCCYVDSRHGYTNLDKNNIN